MSNELVGAIENIGRAFDEFKATNDERLDEERKGNEARASELKQKLDSIEKEITTEQKKKREIEARLESQKDRIELLESVNDRPKGTIQDKLNDEYKTAFVDWMRSSGKDREAEEKMRDLKTKAREFKDIVIGTDASGGYAVPEQISAQVDALLLKRSDILNEIDMVQVGTSDYKELISIYGGTSGWVAETGTRSATGTPNLRQISPTWGELYAYPQVSEWSLQDAFFNVENWLVNDIADGMGQNLEAAIYNGNGSDKPTGMFNTTPVATADHASPLRDKAAFEYIPTDSASPQAMGFDDVIDLTYSLNRRYRSGAKFAANTTTQGALRKLKDSNGQYLWQPSLQVGQPDRLMGYETFTWEDLADHTTADGLYLAFGDFRRSYVMTFRRELAITTDQVTSPGYTKFYIRRRYGGIVRNNDALKVLKLADS
jgi:HK97 family phage major capsid protein